MTADSITQLTNAIPSDPELLAAMGRVTIRHTQLDYMLRMTIRTLTGVEIRDALDATSRAGSAQLRDRVRSLARARLGDGTAFVQLEALLQRCRLATEKRNALTHSMWAGNLDANTFYVRTEDHQWKPTPTVDELMSLSSELLNLANTVNTVRLEGYLHEALRKAR